MRRSVLLKTPERHAPFRADPAARIGMLVLLAVWVVVAAGHRRAHAPADSNPRAYRAVSRCHLDSTPARLQHDSLRITLSQGVGPTPR